PKRRDPGAPLDPVQLDELVERGLNLLPPSRLHRTTQRRGSPRSSSASQARAERSSRLAVASETPSAAALSSSDRPPKYRYCNSRPWRGLSSASRLIASSSSVQRWSFSSRRPASASRLSGDRPASHVAVRRPPSPSS